LEVDGDLHVGLIIGVEVWTDFARCELGGLVAARMHASPSSGGHAVSLYLRLLSVGYAVRALLHLADVFDLRLPFPRMPPTWKAWIVFLLVADTFAAVGLWHRRRWGVALRWVSLVALKSPSPAHSTTTDTCGTPNPRAAQISRDQKAPRFSRLTARFGCRGGDLFYFLIEVVMGEATRSSISRKDAKP
jgi:hypothetical protein